MTITHPAYDRAGDRRRARALARAAVHERVGPFEIRLADGVREVARLQRLRFGVFFRDGGAVAGAAAAGSARDLCPFDAICDHLIVVDRSAPDADGPTVVGTYRLLRRDVALCHGGFYSQGEFDLAPLLARHPQLRFLELGRSCVDPAYRSKRVIELLWRGLWLYTRHHGTEALIGCASLPGLDLDGHRRALSYLRHHAAAEADWHVAALPHRAVPFAPLSREAVDPRRDLLALPPLIKAYLRAGARFSGDVVLDRPFATTDVFAVMPMAAIEARYLAHYGARGCVSQDAVA